MDKQQKQEAKYKTKAFMGIMNDKLEVGMSKLRGEEGKDLDVAIIKATLQDEVVPKEKHVRTLKIACSGSAPRQQVSRACGVLCACTRGTRHGLATCERHLCTHATKADLRCWCPCKQGHARQPCAYALLSPAFPCVHHS